MSGVLESAEPTPQAVTNSCIFAGRTRYIEKLDVLIDDAKDELEGRKATQTGSE